MSAEKRPPYMKFYARDWRGDGALRMCSFAARGLWADLLSLMHDEGEPYGHLVINGAQPTSAQLARMLGGTARELEKLLKELEEAGVFSRTEDGAIFSRRMVRDKEKEIRDRENGKGGGNPKIRVRDNGGVNPPDKAHSQSQKPEPSSATQSNARAPDAAEVFRLQRVLGIDETVHRHVVRDLQAVIALKAEGCDFEKHLLPAAEQAARSGPKGSVSYIAARARELRDAERTVATLPIPFEPTDMQGWRDRVRVLIEHGLWHAKNGPKPGEAGCMVPSEILAEFNLLGEAAA